AEWPALTAALAADHSEDALAELRAVLAEQYRLTFRYRRPLLLLTKCALEFPGLADVFVAGLRDRLLDLLAGYLSRRARAGLLRTVPDFHAAAALMVQAIAWSALQRPHDPGMTALSDEVAETATLDLLVHGMRPLS
ncbi:MAG: regulatory protein TetR, partial [Akkermansiaceae bacterium]|nr:regulatory protein TetR [Akkermansiaceae bacterium]